MNKLEDLSCQKINNEEEYKKLFEDKNDLLYIIEVYTEWCGSCIFMFEIMNKIYKNNYIFSDGVKIFSVCAKTVTTLKNYDNNAMPFYLIIKNGEIIQQIVGCNIPHMFLLIDEHLKK
ncbi:thioredoxin-like protein [Hepatocystis sp. ex Piliocolobus tephrosceles]|nr:thioredoxin-like protein [Hepatocystis sp. ex Piliocolobus tephrosceles]